MFTPLHSTSQEARRNPQGKFDLWKSVRALSVRFGLGAANMGHSDDQFYPRTMMWAKSEFSAQVKQTV